MKIFPQYDDGTFQIEASFIQIIRTQKRKSMRSPHRINHVNHILGLVSREFKISRKTIFLKAYRDPNLKKAQSLFAYLLHEMGCFTKNTLCGFTGSKSIESLETCLRRHAKLEDVDSNYKVSCENIKKKLTTTGS